MIAQNSIEQLLNAAIVEDVVGDYVTLKRSGSRYKGLCPFHDEKTPSFVVSPTLGIYKCFGCQKGGNAINFLMDIENLSYVEATRSLALRYGIELIETGGKDNEEYKENLKLRENLQIVLDYSQKFFEYNLYETEEGKLVAMEYFRERGFDREVLNHWGLGYSPSDWDALTVKAKSDGYTIENLELAGVVRKKENGGHFDLFRNRVIFPIHSVSGKIIGFAGRKMTSTDTAPKYVNSPETELYKKSEILYGIYQAKNTIKKEDKVYLTEGYTDVITLAQYGIENVVASSGTALTPGQIKLIRRFTPNITVLYDGDVAGIKASLRGINLLLAEDLNVRIVSLPGGEDPDSLCRKLGEKDFKDYLIAHEENFIFFKANLLLSDIQNDPIKKSDAVRDILESVAEIRDPLKRNALTAELAKICAMDEALLASELGKLVRKKAAGNAEEVLTELKQITEAAGITFEKESLGDEFQERAFLRALLLYGHKPFNEELSLFSFALQELENDNIVVFQDPLCSLIMKELMQNELRSWPGQAYFIGHANQEVSQWAAGVLSQGHDLSPAYADNYIYVLHENENYKQEVINIFVHLRRKKLDNMIKLQIESLKTDVQNVEDILLYIDFLKGKQMRIAQEIGGAVFSI